MTDSVVHLSAEDRRAVTAVFRAMAITIAHERRVQARQRARRSAMRTAYHRRRRNRRSP